MEFSSPVDMRSVASSLQTPPPSGHTLLINHPNSVHYTPRNRQPAAFDSGGILRSYSIMLQCCTSQRSFLEGKSVHARLIRSNVEPDVHLWDCLVNFYSKCSLVDYARNLLDEMPQRDVVAWTSLISGYVLENKGREGVRMVYEMQKEGIQPNGFTLAAGLKACGICLDLSIGRQLHGQVIKLQFLSDLFVGSSLVDLYVKCGEVELAEKLFFGLPQHNAVSWNVLLNGYARMGDEKKVVSLYSQIMEFETRLNKHTLSIVLKCCACSGDVRQGRVVHCLVVKTGLDIDEYLGCALIDVYSKSGLVDDSCKIFARMEERDVAVWSAMISCFDQQGFDVEAVELFRKMNHAGVKPNQFTMASIASVACQITSEKFCASVHAFILKSGFAMENTLGNSVMNMYMKNGAVQDGCMVFNELMDTDTISWNTLLSGFHSGRNCEEGLRIFRQMLIENFTPNKYTFISILRSCTSLMASSYGTQIHAHILKNGLDKDSFVGTALVDMYTSCSLMENALLVFDRMKERDVFSWTVIITAYAKADQGEEAIRTYKQMQRESVLPNEFTLASCLRACSNLAALDTGRQLHSQTIKSGHSDAYVSTALTDMYVKCGCIRDAEAVFEGSTSRDIVFWNTMICGFSQHGYGQKALNLFQYMMDEGIKPDNVTFIGVLSACGHAGLLDAGKKYFDSLECVYGITPTIEHYACMVGILGRGGRLDEVESFINEMTLVPDISIWQTVLATCRKLGNIDVAERVSEKLFKMEPLMDSAYVLLANAYASSKRWNDVARIRRMMSNHRVKKEPGCSWIEISGQVHVFLSQDISHPCSKEIYLKLRELNQEMVLSGYVPETEFLHIE
ncbi:TPR-like protein [Dioscorea alata]|uniref:TPR-like protein n=1 Tax=Dioscorea alata TaxID=55571 RepID=A0ACB7WF22_DIOAL|nr:TPR-like protein [Dioscorea alata]